MTSSKSRRERRRAADRKSAGYLDDLAPHLSSGDVASLLAFLAQMELFLTDGHGDLERYGYSRSEAGHAVAVWFKAGHVVVGNGSTVDAAVKSLSQQLIAEGMKGAASA